MSAQHRFTAVVRAGRVVGVIARNTTARRNGDVARREFDALYALVSGLRTDVELARRWQCPAVFGVADWLRSAAVRQAPRAPDGDVLITFEMGPRGAIGKPVWRVKSEAK